MAGPLHLHQYHFINQNLTWTEAQTYCRQTHTDLATIENSEELKQLINTVSSAGHSSDVWLGLYSEIDWKWSDGSGAQYRNWKIAIEPNFLSANQFCVRLDHPGTWIDYGCMQSYTFICYKGTQLDPVFIFVNERMNWTSAQRYCRENHVDLATVRNSTENQRVLSLSPSAKLSWIGLFRGPNFYWSDRIPRFLFSEWDNVPNQIKSNTVICGVTSVQRSGRWKFLSCESRLPFVCYSLIPVPVTRQVVKLRLELEDSVDLEDTAVKAELLKKFPERLKESGVNGVTLKWREQFDGKVFRKERKRKTEL
ncbi:lymphocyte antigen 75-like [Leuresthes tenuis]|uniref:lymphocyte antigen 75-like n=1 Tax=Leuresthes tenuis TaxID=355514 RepID=UPI003B50598E